MIPLLKKKKRQKLKTVAAESVNCQLNHLLSIFLIKPRFLFVSRLPCMTVYFKSPMTSPAGWGHCGTVARVKLIMMTLARLVKK